MSRWIEERQDAFATAATAAREPRGACAAAAAPLLTVIVPVYNEAATIDELLRRVIAIPLDMQVVVVDDGSSDATTSVLEGWEGHQFVELLAHSRNRGKGAAIRTGLDHARGRFIIVQDADLEYDPADYHRLLAPLLEGAADVVYGSRYAKSTVGNAHPTKPWSLFRLGVCLLNIAARWLYSVRLSDEATCYKVFSTESLRAMRLECERFEFCPEVTAKACRMGLRIVEVPVGYSPRGVADGKKIRCRDGWQALKELWRWRDWMPSIVNGERSEQLIIRDPHCAPVPENV